MKAGQFTKQIKTICEHHNVDINDVTIKFDTSDIDNIPEYDKETKTLVYHKCGYIKDQTHIKHSMTVDEAIDLLTDYKNKLSGSHELEANVTVGGVNFSGLTIDYIEHEDGDYCTLYVQDNYNIYN